MNIIFYCVIVTQAALLLARLFGFVGWSWWLVFAPIETAFALGVALCVYLLSTSDNPFR